MGRNVSLREKGTMVGLTWKVCRTAAGIERGGCRGPIGMERTATMRDRLEGWDPVPGSRGVETMRAAA